MRAHAGALLGFPGREGRGAAEAPAPAVSGDLRPHSGLLLIDCQKAFLTGFWAQYFGGGDEVAPIRQAFRNTVELLRSPERLSGCAVLCTKCYTEGEEADYDDDLKPLLAGAPCFWKPTTDITRNSHFHKWFEERLSAGMQTLVIGGCTTTSCVRVSSQAIRRMYPDSTLRVVVDLSLCGARVSNFLGNAELDPDLVRIYGPERCIGKSPVDLALFQMRGAGVEVLDSFPWPSVASDVSCDARAQLDEGSAG